MVQDDPDLIRGDVHLGLIQAAGHAFVLMAALGVTVALERIGSLASDALTDQRVHVGECACAEARFALAIDQQGVQLGAGHDAQAQVQPLLSPLLYVTDYFHCLYPRLVCCFGWPTW
ncbi:hypothetical protein D3C85_1420500 [compost metagenome]